MLSSVVFIFVLCWTPRVVWDFLAGKDAMDGRRDILPTPDEMEFVDNITMYISYLNSVVNAPIYFLTSK